MSIGIHNRRGKSASLTNSTQDIEKKTFFSWREERSFLLPIRFASQTAFNSREVKPVTSRPFLSRLISRFDLKTDQPLRSRGATLDRIRRSLVRSGYHPKDADIREHTAWFDCSLEEDGAGSFSVALLRDSKTPDRYWGCNQIVMLNLKLSSPQVDQANVENFGLCFHNYYDATCIEGSFLLETLSDEAIDFNFRYFLIAAVNATNDILDAETSYSDRRNGTAYKGISNALRRRIEGLMALRSPESSPIHPRKVCETCGGKKYIEVNGQRQKCTACKGTGYNPSA